MNLSADLAAILETLIDIPPSRYSVDLLVNNLRDTLDDEIRRKALPADTAAWLERNFEIFRTKLDQATASDSIDQLAAAQWAMLLAFSSLGFLMVDSTERKSRGLMTLAAVNASKATQAKARRRRCLEIAAALPAPTAAAVRLRYANKYPNEKTPGERQIRTYLNK